MARDFDKGIDQCQKTLEMDPGFLPARDYLGMNYLGKGMYEDALREFQKTNNQLAMAGIYARMNRKEEARRLLADILEQFQQWRTEIAAVYFDLDENEEGWKWLEKAYQERSYGMTWLKVYPVLDSVRSDPRFQALLKKVGLD